MSYAQQLLQEAEAVYNEHCAGIEKFADDLNILGVILATARRDGIHWVAITPIPTDRKIQLWAPAEETPRLLRRLLALGATIARSVTYGQTQQHALHVPGINADVALITPPLDPEANAQALLAEVAA